MNDYNAAESESSVTNDDCTELEQRDVRAFTEKMTVLPDTGRASDAEGLFLVVSQSGSEYLVDTLEGRCDCPDAHYNLDSDEQCKHERRVAYATGEQSIPQWVNTAAIDSHLGEQTDSSRPAFQRLTLEEPESGTVQPDGGTRTEKAAETAVSGEAIDNAPRYTYHYEPAHVGGKRYVRCETCGAECIPADPDRMLHREGCSEGQR